MNPSGLALAVLGLVVLAMAALRHFTHAFLAGLTHGSVVLIVIGAILLVAGIALGQGGRQQARV